MRFRPCIDLRNGRVVQIVGGSLRDDEAELRTNFETERSPADYARMYRQDRLWGGHVISLGPGNRDAVMRALSAFPGGFHYGGGITPDNAKDYLDGGASRVIVTSYVFSDGRLNLTNLKSLVAAVGKDRLVLDLSCRKRDGAFWIVTDRWQKFTDVSVNAVTLERLAQHCAEFLVHGVDVEGKMKGVQSDLIRMLGRHSPISVTYAGGVRSISDLDAIKDLGSGRVDVTIGSSLDIFGGTIPYRSVVAWHHANQGDAGSA